MSMDDIAIRVATGFVAESIVGKEFPNEKALEEYLHEHPDADRKNHWVTPVDGKPSPSAQPGDHARNQDEAVENSKKRVETQKEKSRSNFEKNEERLTELAAKIQGDTSPVFDDKLVRPAPADIVSSPVEKKPKMTKDDKAQYEDWAERRKAWKSDMKKKLASSAGVQDTAKRYGLKPDIVASTVSSFLADGGGRDTKADLEVSLRDKAKLAIRTRLIEQTRDEGPIPKELMKFMPKSLGFQVKNGGMSELVDTFGNQEKTVLTKIEEMRLLVVQKNKILTQVHEDMKSPDQMTRMLAAITAIGLHTGIRTGGKDNHIEIKERDEDGDLTGKVTVEQTFGATTLQKKHIKELKDGHIKFQFPGKKGTINVAEMDDEQVAGVLQKLIDNKKPSGFVFQTSKGQKVTSTRLNDYVESHFGSTFTDFRKLRGTREVFESLQKGMQSIYEDIAKKQEANRDKMRARVVKVLTKQLQQIFEKAQRRLSHKNVSETIDSYVNPMVVLNMLSYGKMADDFEEAIEGNGHVSFNLDALVAEAAKYKRKAA